MFTTLEIKQFCRWWVTLKTEACINEGVTHFLSSLDCYLYFTEHSPRVTIIGPSSFQKKRGEAVDLCLQYLPT